MPDTVYGRRPAEANLYIQRGSNIPLIWRLRGGTKEAPITLDWTGDEFVISVWVRNQVFVRLSTSGISAFQLLSFLDIDPTSGADPSILDTLRWTQTLEQSRLVPLGRTGARYEIERRTAGSQEVIIRGYFIGVEGINDD